MLDNGVKISMADKKKTTTRKTAVDSAARNPATLSDGCNPELVAGAEFDGIFEMPVIKKPKKMMIPDALVPFSEMDRARPDAAAVCTYENDSEFRELLIDPQAYAERIKPYQGFITPDCSVYRDMPLAVQITNIYRSRAIGYYMQKQGVYVIPNVRWGDERTYSPVFFPERIAFSGIEKNSIVAVGSYGQLKNRTNRYYFEEGMKAMMASLTPKVVLVYSKMPEEIKEAYPSTKFVEYPDWTTNVRKEG